MRDYAVRTVLLSVLVQVAVDEEDQSNVRQPRKIRDHFCRVLVAENEKN